MEYAQNINKYKKYIIMSKTDNNKPPSAQSSKETSLVSLQDNELTKYLKYFLTIEGYKKIEQGKDLLKLLNQEKNDKILEKTMKTICYFLEHATAEGKVCGLQFLKEAMDLAKSKVFGVIEKNAIGVLIDAVQYRNHVKSMVRGSTYFMNKIDKNEKESKIVELVRLSNTYFRMSHQMLYVWGVKYFPNSHFGIVYKKLSKYCTFPQFPNQFKFYRAAKIQQMEKKKEIIQINKLLKDRNVSNIPALSNRSRKSNSKQNDEKNVGKQIQNKNIEKQKEEKNAELDEIEQDIFESQRSNQSKVFLKSSKLALKPKKMQQKIPKNIIYRQSSIEDPEDVTNNISASEYQLNQKQKNHLEIPLGIIPEINTQEGSSKQQSRNNSMRSKSKNEKQEIVEDGTNILKKSSIKEQKDELEEQSEISEKRVHFNQSDNENKQDKVEFLPNGNTNNNTTNHQLKNEIYQQKQGTTINKNKQMGVKVEINGIQNKIEQVQNKKEEKKQTRKTKIGSNGTKIKQQENSNNFTSHNKIQQIDLRKHETNKNKNSIKVECIELKHEQNNWFNDPPKAKAPMKQDRKAANQRQKDAKHTTKSDKQLKNQTIQEISINLASKNNQKVDDMTIIKQQKLQVSTEDIRKANRGEKSYEKILPIQSDIQSSSELSKTNQQKGSKRINRHSSQVKKIKKKIDLDDNENDDFNKNTLNEKGKEQNEQRKENNEGKIKYKRPLSFNQVYQIKQLSLVSKIEQQDLKQKVENERKLNSVRKFKRFRQVALTLLPGQSQKQQKMSLFFQAQKQELQNIATKLVTDILKIQQQKSRLQTSSYIEQIKSLIKKPQQTVNGWEKKIRSRGQLQGSSSKVKNRSNSSKRSSLSQIRNKNEAFFQQGTMLHLMAKRKSVLI